MLQNAYFLAKIGADTAENEQHFAELRVPVRQQQPERYSLTLRDTVEWVHVSANFEGLVPGCIEADFCK